MVKLEKKFKVDSFEAIENRLAELGAESEPEITATHYYAPMEDGLVTKLVDESTGIRITQLKEVDGTFEFVQRISVESVEEGMQWLKENGFNKTKKVKMTTRPFALEDGKVELIDINEGKLLSVILFYEPTYHEEKMTQLGLESAETIEVPFSELV